MNMLLKRILSLAMCALLLVSAIAAAAEDDGITKDETVYVLTDANGAVEKVIVSDLLKNTAGADKIIDRSELSKIENVKGNETFTKSEGNLIWNANGNDICYQGISDAELPVKMTISYFLNGEAVTAKELAGRSGSVKIRFDYANTCPETVELNEGSTELFVPFAAVTGMLLDTDVFTNIVVTNGRLINDGDRALVVGLAFPGLKESIGLTDETVSIPDYLEITAEASHFELGMTVTMVTNALFNEIDRMKPGFADELTDSLNSVEDLLDELVSGIGLLNDGASALIEGVSALNDGAVQISDGMTELTAGLDALTENNETLTGGAKTVFETLLATADEQLAAAGLNVPALTIDGYAETLELVLASLDEIAVRAQAQEQVTAAVEANRDLINQQVTDAVYEQVAEQVTGLVTASVREQVTGAVREEVAAKVIAAAARMSREDYDSAVEAGMIDAETQAVIENAVEQQMASDEVQAMIDGSTAAQLETETVHAVISANTDEQMRSETVLAVISENTQAQIQKLIDENMASEEVRSRLAAAKEGAAAITSLKDPLNQYNLFYRGLIAYTDGVASAASGASELSEGTAALKAGTETLAAGSTALSEGLTQLNTKITALVNGSDEVGEETGDVLNKLREEGLRSVLNCVNETVTDLAGRLDALMNLSESYINYSGIGDGMNGRVSFVFRSAEIRMK